MGGPTGPIASDRPRITGRGTIGPLAKAGIPIWLRSTFEPDKPGTIIGADMLSLAQELSDTPQLEAVS